MTERGAERDAKEADAMGGAVVDPVSTPCAACAPCVAQVTSDLEATRTLRDGLLTQSEPMVTLTWLLRVCRDEHTVLRSQMNDPAGQRQYAVTTGCLSAIMAAPGGETILNEQVRQELADLVRGPGARVRPVAALAAAHVLDGHYAHTFAAFFRASSPYSPAAGDPVPLDSPDLPSIITVPTTSPPWRLANRLDETRHVRLAGGWANQFQVVFDYSASRDLAGVIDRHAVVATCHPNRVLSDFSWPRDADGRSFPVAPADVDRQRVILRELIGRACGAGASVIVLPELCVNEALARELKCWVDLADGPRLLVAGSFHHGAKQGRRRNTAIAWVRGRSDPLECEKYSAADRPVMEGIQPQGRPEIRVFVTDDGWHLVLAICRDLLNPHAVHTMGEIGVNLVLVPAMSESLVPFGGPTAQLVGMTQALVVIANNPAEWTDNDIDLSGVREPARALFGHPGYGQQTRFVRAPDARPGVAVLAVGSGELTWLPQAVASQSIHGMGAERLSIAAGGSGHAALNRVGDMGSGVPTWLVHLVGADGQLSGTSAPRRAAGQDRVRSGARQPPRQAAVLVLVSGDPDDPKILLTERAGDLADYPGCLVFPGGLAEPGDSGPVSTALREAREETGLKTHKIELVGLLPAYALAGGLVVSPVVFWVPELDLTGSVNVAEVAALNNVRLCDVSRLISRPSGCDASGDGRTAPLGRMTTMVLHALHDAFCSRGELSPAARPDDIPGPGHNRASGLSWPARSDDPEEMRVDE